MDVGDGASGGLNTSDDVMVRVLVKRLIIGVKEICCSIVCQGCRL